MKMPLDGFAFVLGDVSRLMRREFRKRLEGSSLTQAEARALIFVSRNEGIRQVDLADLLEIKPITLARLLDQLAEEKTIERRADPSDRRAYRIFLTPAATPILAAIHHVANAIQKDALHAVTKKESETLHTALRRMRDNLASTSK